MEFDFANAFGPTFWIIMAAGTVLLAVGGYWLGGLIARKTDTGFGGFMLVVLVTIVIASSVIPLAVFAGIGDIMAMVNPMAPIDETMFMDQGLDGFSRIIVAALASTAATVVFFIASVIGLARGRA